MITADVVQDRLSQLDAQRQQMLDQLNALLGAMSDCQHWLELLQREAAENVAEAPAKSARKR